MLLPCVSLGGGVGGAGETDIISEILSLFKRVTGTRFQAFCFQTEKMGRWRAFPARDRVPSLKKKEKTRRGGLRRVCPLSGPAGRSRLDAGAGQRADIG